MKHFFTAFLLFTSLQAAVFAQTPVATATPPKISEDEVVVVSTNLIQVDAIVTGKDGKQVTDLTPEDFEVLENGEKQKITNFSYVSVTPEVASATAENKTKPVIVDKLAPPVPVRLKPEQVRRTIALVVDDLGLSFESMAFVRQALKKFVDEQMQLNDLVAIVRTGGGIGALQQFTSDKRQLYAAIEKMRFNLIGRSGVAAFAPIEPSLSEIVANQTRSPIDADNAKVQKQSAKDADNFRTDVFAVGTLGALNYIVRGMRELPGRKAVVLMSDGFSILNRDADGNLDPNAGQRVLDALRRLTDAANRASVVVNTVDARGLQTLGLTASDDTSGLTSDQVEQRLSDRKNELFDTQQGLQYLAQQTGGRAFRNNNDIKGSVEKVLDDQKGYYLLGYQPDTATFDPKQRRFNKLIIKINRPGLKVRYRSGFFGVADEDAVRSAKLTPQQQISSALTSPFGANGVNMRLNTVFGNDAKMGSYIRSLLHVDAKDLKFTDEPDGVKKAVFDVIALTFGDNGAPIDSVSKTYTVRIPKDELPRLLEKGFIYYVNVPIKKPGAYQLRIALRDEGSEKIGAANQFVEVPNLKKNRLTLSGLILQSMTFEQYQKMSQGQQAAAGNNQPDEVLDSQTDTALRRFKRGSVLQYGYAVYNAKVDTTSRPQLTAQLRLFRDGKPVFEGKPVPLDFTGQTDFQHLNAGSALALPANMELGDYVLQVIVTDSLAKEKNRIATQYVEFELTN
jgi:VWFA-related protein